MKKSQEEIPQPCPQAEIMHSVCKMRTSALKIVYRILTKALADKWQEEQVFTGTHKECQDHMSENNINNLS